jgi:hypothetical protein
MWEMVIATWELRAPYRAYESYVPYSTAWEPHGSRHCMGAMGTIWEPDGATCKLDGAIYELAYWSHMRLMGAIWELSVPYGMRMPPDGSHMCHIGATCTVWEPHALWETDDTILEPHGCMGAICELYALYGSRLHHIGDGMYHMGATFTIWVLCGSSMGAK